MYIESLFPKVMLVHLFSDTFLGARARQGMERIRGHPTKGDDYAATLRILAFSIHPKLTIRVEHFPDFLLVEDAQWS